VKKPKKKISTQTIKELLPRTLRMKYATEDVLKIGLEVGMTEDIDCVDTFGSKGDFIATYKLISVRKK